MEAPEQGTEENVGLLVLEAKSLRPFKTKDEYLYAMKEDLAEWFKCLYAEILIDADNFLEVLETGVILCQHANEVRKFTAEQKAKGEFEMKSNFVRDIQIPGYDVQFRIDVKPGTFLARDNISNFITWTAKMGIPEVLRFETDDLVLRKNERSVVLCLLEVARVGAKFGMLAPTIVQMEEEIDNEIETGEPPPQIKTCDIKSLDEMVRELVGRCTCPVQFPIIKVGEGKYKIGDNQTLVFVRILRKHVMIRVGGGWDTLEHYLDRHDPCRCRFEGHRSTGRGPSTPRRASSSSISQSVPTTPKTPRKLSMTTPVQSTHSGSVARPASPGMRSPSPGPNAKKLSLVTKGVSNSQPGSCVTSPNIANKMPNFSSTLPRDFPSQSDVSGSGNFSVGNFVKQSQNFFARQLSSGSGGGTLPRQTTPRRSASPAFRSQSPGPRRSESPAPVVSDRLRSPSPVHSKKKAAHAQIVHPAHESRNGRCESPIKQITLSELRSSREGKPVTSQKPNTPRSVRRQTSTTSSNGDKSEMATDPSNPNLTIDKISTMSLGEFKSLLNSALSVPNGTAGSQTSSDSPRSQTSVDNNNKKTSLKSNTGYKSASYKSAPSSRSASANRNLTTGSGYHQSKVAGTKVSEKYPESSSSGYSTSSSIIDRTAKTNVPTSGLRSRTPSGKQNVTNGVTSSTVLNKTISTSSNKSNTPSTNHENRRPRTPTSLYKSNSNSSSISETPNTLQPGYRSNYASRSSSHSSLKSYESTDSHSLDDRASQHSDPSENVDRVPLTPSSATSDYSLRNSYTSNPESPGQTVSSRANTNSSSEHKLNGGHFVSSVCDQTGETVGYTNGIEIREENPRNVGYAYMFSYSDKPETKDCAYTENRKRELNELENELAELTARADSEMDMIDNQNKDESKSLKQTTARSHTPVGRSHTPSLIPRPMTPKISRKTLTTPLNDNDIIQSDDKKPAGRPPTPKKSSIIARAPASSVRSADRGKEQTYREIFHKRSMTPGPDSRSTATSQANARRSSTPGPYLKKSNLSSTSATTTRARLNESLEQKNENQQLSVFSGDKTSVVERSRRESVGSVRKRSQSMDRKALTNQQSETVILVNRSNGQHSLDVQGENRPPAKSKVLARARNEDTRSRADTRQPITRQRPQSVEPKQLIPRKQLSAHNGQENEEHEVYNRTQEWVQTAVAQTKVQKNKTPKVLPRSRRSMTPNSFDMHKDVTDDEEPRTLEEIKAALSLPIQSISTIDPDKLDAPPEDPDAYHQMEKLFHELRQQELKNSVNETPGTSVHGTKSSKSKSKSNSSANEEDMSVDSNRNAKKKTWSVSTKSSTNVTSPACSDRASSKTPKSPYGSNTKSGTHNLSSGSISGFPNSATKTYSQSPKVVKSESVATTSVANSSRTASASSASSQRPPSPRTTPRPMSPHVMGTTTPRPSSPAFKVQTHSQKSSVSSTSSNPPRPSSPAFKSQQNVQRSSSNSSNPVRPSSPAFKNQTQKVTTPTASTTQRPASPAFKSPTASTRSSVSSTPSLSTRPATSGNRVKSPAPSTPGTQPSRPASTPPRPSTPVSRQSSKTSDDSVFDSSDKKLDAITGSGILSKLKEIIKVKPRKDKQDKVKTRIPAPKSLANHRKSQSFSNLTHLSDSMSLAHTCPDLGTYTTENHDVNVHPKENGWCLEDGLNATVSNKADVAQPRLMTPLNTGRSTLIRKESMDKNKEIHKMTRAMSVERNINSLNRYPYLDEGEYV